jgi:hypothetical protein
LGEVTNRKRKVGTSAERHLVVSTRYAVTCEGAIGRKDVIGAGVLDERTVVGEIGWDFGFVVVAFGG